MSVLMICSTSHRQKGVSLLLLVAGAVSLYFVRARFFSFFFLISWCTAVKIVKRFETSFLHENYDALKYYYQCK